jgi:pyruvate dehydrogenase complex dehydrogenase (E1) component
MKTIKGYGLGEAGEGRNITHQQKKLNEDELREFRSRFGIPISDEEVAQAPFYKPAEDSLETQYLQERRRELGGYVPSRKVYPISVHEPADDLYEEFFKGTDGREVATTMAFVRLLAKLLREKELGKLIVPIIPDEARRLESIRMWASCMIRSIARLCSTTKRRETGRSWKKASPRPVPCPPSSPPEPLMPLIAFR